MEYLIAWAFSKQWVFSCLLCNIVRCDIKISIMLHVLELALLVFMLCPLLLLCLCTSCIVIEKGFPSVMLTWISTCRHTLYSKTHEWWTRQVECCSLYQEYSVTDMKICLPSFHQDGEFVVSDWLFPSTLWEIKICFFPAVVFVVDRCKRVFSVCLQSTYNMMWECFLYAFHHHITLTYSLISVQLSEPVAYL